MIEAGNMRANLAVLLALAAALALLALLAAGDGEQRDTPTLNFRGINYDTARDPRVAGHSRRLRLRVHLAGRVALAEPALRPRLATFAIVKAIRENQSVTPSPYRWEPKQAFHALAEHYDAAD